MKNLHHLPLLNSALFSCKPATEQHKESPVTIDTLPIALTNSDTTSVCDIVYDTITNEKYKMHLVILDKFYHQEKRGYFSSSKSHPNYFMFHVSHPVCNAIPTDSLENIFHTEMREPHDGAKQVKEILLENLEKSKTN